jgi:hypothetical protein
LNHKLNVTAYDKFMKAVNAGMPTECAIKKLVEGLGIKITKQRSETGIAAVSALQKVYNREGSETLERALRIIRDAYGPAAYDHAMIAGFGKLCGRYNGQIDEPDAVRTLSKAHGGNAGLMNRAEQLRRTSNIVKEDCIAACAVDTINRGRSRGKKLPSWFKPLAEVEEAVMPKKKKDKKHLAEAAV